MRPETKAAIEAVSVAQRLADARDGAADISSKGGIDLVTRTDLACEDAIRDVLIGSFPDYPVIGEERGGVPLQGLPYWLVDPICGTRPFASNVPLYCSNVALVEDGAVTLAAIGVGRTGETLHAEKGKGAWMRSPGGEVRLSVSTQSNTIFIDGKTDQTPDVVRAAMRRKRWYVWMFSSTVSYAYLAAGRVSGIIQFSAAPPVHGSLHAAAGCFVSSEAGAVVTDIADGGPWQLNTQSYVIAATAELNAELLELVRSVS